MDAETTVSKYASWAVSTFETRIHPVIESLRTETLPGVDPRIWLDTCAPGPTTATRFRLFPGAFFLLWVEALGGSGATDEAEPVAAAIELVHNASLVHDDMIDRHTVRKGQKTMYALFGGATALLGGDGLCATAFSALSRVPQDRLSGSLFRFGQAIQDVVAGQLLDESERWALVSRPDRWAHWLNVCQGKLAIGNLAGPLAAFWVGQEALEADVRRLLADYSVVSQIINDFGDLLGFSGYHVPAPSLRSVGEESAKKPTLPLIWSESDEIGAIQSFSALLRRARGEINQRKELAVHRLGQLSIHDSVLDILLDFFVSPALPALGSEPS